MQELNIEAAYVGLGVDTQLWNDCTSVACNVQIGKADLQGHSNMLQVNNAYLTLLSSCRADALPAFRIAGVGCV